MKIFRSYIYYSLVISVFFLISCGDEEGDDMNDDMNNDEQLVDITDGMAIVDAMSIPGATEVDGDPPAPSTDPDAPALDPLALNLIVGQDQSLAVDLDVISGDVAGFYFQVDGTESYFDIPATAAGGRLSQILEDDGFDVDFSDTFQPGQFCAEVCVYDAENRVSNIVEICVEIAELGGDNTDFLTANSWTAISLSGIDDDGAFTQNVGEIDFFTFSFFCDGAQSVEVTEEERIDFINITFVENGSVTFSVKEYYKELDLLASTCDNLVFMEETDTENATGIWSFDDTIDELTLVIDDNDPDPDSDEPDREVLIFTTSTDGDNLVLELSEDFGESTTIVFAPVN